LWWFAELYLHKERTIVSLFRAIHATRALFAREKPDALQLDRGDAVARLVLPQLAAQHRVAYEGPPRPQSSRIRRAMMDARSTALMLAAVGSPQRPARRGDGGHTSVAAIVHRAFWRGDTDNSEAESYIGPVLQALERELPAGAVRYVGVGPVTNFRARRWWRPAAGRPAIRPIETLVPRTALAGSLGLWAARRAMLRAMDGSADLRRASVILGCDCWPAISEVFAGIALLQFPWSARAMDEAGAAFDALGPQVALTYAEAGGWGRALVLEARRRAIPIVGLQHGFIYRHWLNYLHEPDEMRSPAAGSADTGFPLPTQTLVFDEYAASHLRDAGHFPDAAIAVTGSPRLDQLAATMARLDADEVHAARAAAGATETQALVVLVTKYTEVRTSLPGLLAAVRSMPSVQLAIKAHPAETTDPYEAAASGLPNVRVLPAATPLAPLMRACRALVTVNSTVALDGLALGLPALSIGLPNNLSPFVTAGAIAGARSEREIAGELERLLYDEEFRRRLMTVAASLAAKWRMAPDGGAAGRSARVIVARLSSSPAEM
jgi:hypothetical protein